MYKELFTPGKIGTMTVKNRIFLAPMGTGALQNPDGGFSERLKDYFEAIAKGGTGLLLTGSTVMTKVTGVDYLRKPLSTIFLDTTYVGGASEMCDAVHRWGGKMCIQLTPGDGRLWSHAGETPVSASDGLSPVLPPNILSRAATLEEIKTIVKDYRRVATLCKQAGFDAIEIRAYGGYFTDQFMTAAWNKRTDEYGGNLDGRLKLLMEMIQAVREGAGDDYPLIVKFSPLHYFEGGRTIDEGIEIAQRLEAASVDALHLEKGSHENWWDVIPPQLMPFANQLDISEIIKKVVKIPVMGNGKLGIKPELAEQALADGKIDFIGLGRSLLSDAQWANKVKEGRLQDVKHCIGCQAGCLGRIFVGKYISCALSPGTGNEKERRLEPACRKKTVLVIGGGPGGIEAALTASRRGHDVTIVEKEPELGGALRAASVMPFKSQMQMLRDYYTVQLSKEGVNIECGTTATRKTIEEKKPDAVVVATGATPKAIGNFDDTNKKNVFTTEQVLFDQSLLAKLGKKVVLAGGGEIGCEVALYLLEKRPDLDITVVEMLSDIALYSNPTLSWYLRHRFKELGVKLLLDSKIIGIGDEQIEIERGGSNVAVQADAVILALGYESNNDLAKELEGSANELYVVGDCLSPRKVIDAVWEGFEAGRTI